MRRTYKSKKDIGPWLDHKNVLFSTDDKNTAFEACFIENIKQTKRELSCIASKKQYKSIRKRKYVKRVVKEAESPNCKTHSKSTILTPNKSIHVNKALDPFDMLLNSPSLQVNKASDPFDKLLGSSSSQIKPVESDKDLLGKISSSVKYKRSYHMRRVSNKKKHNYLSNDDTDSDKENRCDATDIGTHKLLIEKEYEPSPEHHDESITNIIKNISLLNNIKSHQNNSISSDKRNEPYRCKLSLRNNSRILQQKSPICSTPFMVKHRGKSMFKLSPIDKSGLCESPKNIADMEDIKNDSVIFICSKSIVKRHLQLSPMSHSCSNNSKDSTTCKTFVEPDKFSSERISSIGDHFEKDIQKFPLSLKQLSNDCKELPQIKSSQTMEAEQFLGLSYNSLQEIKNTTPIIDNHKKDNSIIYSFVEDDTLPTQPFLGFTIVDKQQIDSESNGSQNNDSTQPTSNETSSDNTSLNSVREDRVSLYDTCNESAHEEVREKIMKIPVLKIEKINHALFKEYFDKLPNYEHSRDQYDNLVENDSNNSLCSQNTYSSDNISKKSMDSIKPRAHKSIETNNLERNETIDLNYTNSIYEFDDTVADNGNNSSNDNNNSKYNQSMGSSDNISEKSMHSIEAQRGTVINKLEKSQTIDSSYENSIDQFDDVLEDNTHNCSNNMLCTHNLNSSDNISENSIISLETDAESNNVEKSETIYSVNNSEILLSSEECTDSNSNNEEDGCINFVTIRRQKKVLDDSEMIYNNTYQSFSTASPSTECEKTLLSVTKMNINETSFPALHTSHHEYDTISNETIRDEKIAKHNETNCVTNTDECYASKNEMDIVPDLRPSYTTRNCPRIRESITNHPDILVPSESNRTSSQMRPPIVLQPGKKWERSLSIYKRFTMVDHFDKSILKDEPLENKGRNYRQSIINTMQMQENNDSLHNESINSRRSTIVFKPSRSTIKIVKEPNSSRISLCTTTAYDDLKGFLNEDCDDTVLDLSKLSIADIEHEVTVLEKVHDTSSRTPTAQDYVLRRCNQTEPLLFDECYPDTVLKNCHKIGEGVYGEVYLWRASDGRARVMKIVPIAGTTRVNGEHQKDYHEIISEIVIAMELSALRAPIASIDRHFDEDSKEILDLHTIGNATDVFNEVLAVRCVYGTYPSRLLDLWELYDETKGSENDNPAVLPPDQQYIVLELANAGQDLESYQFNSAEQAHALFIQVAFGLAVAEEAFQFEHRDLHWGNVLIAPTDQKFATFVLRGRTHRVPRCGVAATIIDYTLSRVSLPLAGNAVGGETVALYNDLATDDGLFDAVGDYQFDVYRHMRDKLGNDWKNFEPYTNILWLHYTVDKMITALRYKRTNTKIHKHYIAKLKSIKNRILDYGSAAQFLLTDNEY